MIAISSAENLQQYNGRFFFIVMQILAFAWNPKMVREAKNLSQNFK